MVSVDETISVVTSGLQTRWPTRCGALPTVWKQHGHSLVRAQWPDRTRMVLKSGSSLRHRYTYFFMPKSRKGREGSQ